MGGDHAPDFASNAAALAYISGLEIAKGNGDIIDYSAPLYSLKRNVEGNPRQSIFMIKQYNTTIGCVVISMIIGLMTFIIRILLLITAMNTEMTFP